MQSVRVSGGISPGENRRDDWQTPDYIYDPINAVYQFSFDLAASDENHLAPRYLTIEEDALSFEWTLENLLDRCRPSWLMEPPRNLNIWVNFPFDDADSWIYHCMEGARNGLTVVAMCPANTDRPWFRHGVMKHSRWFVYGDDECRGRKTKQHPEGAPRNRIPFIDPTGEKRDAPGKGNVLAIFDPPLPKCWHQAK